MEPFGAALQDLVSNRMELMNPRRSAQKLEHLYTVMQRPRGRPTLDPLRDLRNSIADRSKTLPEEASCPFG